MKKSEKVTSSYLQGITSSFDQVTSDARKWFDENKNEGSQWIFDIKCPFVGVDHSNTFDTNCISLPKGTSVKICNENGKIMIIVEPKEVKHEFKKGDVLSCHVGKKTWIVIFKGINESKVENKLEYYCILDYNGVLTLNADCYEGVCWHYATEEEKRSLFLAMLNKGMFWDENKMKVRTLKDGDIVTIEDIYNCIWYSIFEEIKDGSVYSYSDLNNDGDLYHGVIPLGYMNRISTIRYATTEERQTLFDKIEEKEHQKWNAETKCFENIRWRAKEG